MILLFASVNRKRGSSSPLGSRTVIAASPSKPWISTVAIAFAPSGGDFYVADGYGSNYVHRYNSEGKYISTFGGTGTPRDEELARLKREEPDNFGDIQELEAEIEKLSARIHRVPFLDTFDLKYNLLVIHKQK